uniref:Uncharacterized protein n=1 Tax=Rhipicephalus appendiculatus TaxID=34631 RepID=A0A131YCX8_RHIAP
MFRSDTGLFSSIVMLITEWYYWWLFILYVLFLCIKYQVHTCIGQELFSLPKLPYHSVFLSAKASLPLCSNRITYQFPCFFFSLILKICSR